MYNYQKNLRSLSLLVFFSILLLIFVSGCDNDNSDSAKTEKYTVEIMGVQSSEDLEAFTAVYDGENFLTFNTDNYDQENQSLTAVVASNSADFRLKIDNSRLTESHDPKEGYINFERAKSIEDNRIEFKVEWTHFIKDEREFEQALNSGLNTNGEIINHITFTADLTGDFELTEEPRNITINAENHKLTGNLTIGSGKKDIDVEIRDLKIEEPNQLNVDVQNGELTIRGASETHGILIYSVGANSLEMRDDSRADWIRNYFEGANTRFRDRAFVGRMIFRRSGSLEGTSRIGSIERVGEDVIIDLSRDQDSGSGDEDDQENPEAQIIEVDEDDFKLQFPDDELIMGEEDEESYNPPPPPPSSPEPEPEPEPTEIEVIYQPVDTSAGETILGQQIFNYIQVQEVYPTAKVSYADNTPAAGVEVAVELVGADAAAAVEDRLAGTSPVTTDENGLAVFNDLKIEVTSTYILKFSTADLNVYSDSFKILSNQEFVNGDGSFDDPYQITNWYHLAKINTDGPIGAAYLESYYILLNDLDADTPGYEELAGSSANDAEGWDPIGDLSNQFKGNFDGNNKTIKDLFISRPDEEYIGLFGRIDNAVIQDLNLLNIDISGKSKVGSIVGYNNIGVIENITVSGVLSGNNESIGGLVGSNYNNPSWNSNSKINNCQTDVDINAVGSHYVGGIVGRSDKGKVLSSSAQGNITGSNYVGGLVGDNGYGSSLSESYFTGTVSGSSYVGGIVGIHQYAYGKYIADSYSTGTVSGKNYVGGLAGSVNNDSHISGSYTEGSVTGYFQVGGLVGNNTDGEIINSHSAAVVTIGDDNNPIGRIGGLIGYHNGGNIENSYTAGEVTAAASDVGGLVGLMSGGSIDNSYSTAPVTGLDNTGGLAGSLSEGTVKNSYAAGAERVEGNERVGGLVGSNGGGIIENSYSSKEVKGFKKIGGLVGDNGNIIRNSYAAGGVESTSTGLHQLGGLAGNNGGQISNCYSTGNLVLPTSIDESIYVGSLVGVTQTAAVITDSFTFESPEFNVVGKNNGSSNGRVTEASQLEMQKDEIYTELTLSGYADLAAAWDSSIWTFGTESIPAYPVLYWE